MRTIKIRIADVSPSMSVLYIEGLSGGERLAVHEAAHDIRWAGWRDAKMGLDLVAQNIEQPAVSIGLDVTSEQKGVSEQIIESVLRKLDQVLPKAQKDLSIESDRFTIGAAVKA